MYSNRNQNSSLKLEGGTREDSGSPDNVFFLDRGVVT